MATRQKTPDNSVADYRYDATRKNIPPAALASQGRIQRAPKQRYFFDPHLTPTVRFDETGQSDNLRGLLDLARQRKLKDSEVDILEQCLSNREPWIEWTGKRERNSWFEVDPVALHIHERISAQAAIRIAARQNVQRGLWADPELAYHEAVQFYKHDVGWSNRLILGDCLSVMNSLATREDMAGKVQMIYVDPPYGIGFRSNFQPLVRNRNVRERDADLTREPEMVKAYRDTWTLGVHTYLTYLRDRLTVSRHLLTDTGSIFVQIGQDNVHRVRALLDEIFGANNCVGFITYRTSVGLGAKYIDGVCNYILWFAKDKTQLKYSQLYKKLTLGGPGATRYNHVEDVDGSVKRTISKDPTNTPNSKRFFKQGLTSRTGSATTTFGVEFEDRNFKPTAGGWRTNAQGMSRLIAAGRISIEGRRLTFKKFFDDFGHIALTDFWDDVSGGVASRSDPKIYVTQTAASIVQRCMLMTTEPGDLVLDPTCGSGTTAYVAEQWGRRWITIDTSRVAIALARQRILTAKFDRYQTTDGSNTIGEAGFKFNAVPQITLGSIAQNVALDPVFLRWEPVLDGKLNAINDAISQVSTADRRSWDLPRDKWQHWEVPLDAGPNWPCALKDALDDYRVAWRRKMEEINACIAANAEQKILVDQPEVQSGVVRVSGPFTVESVHPPEESLGVAAPISGAPEKLNTYGDDADFVDIGAPSNAEAFHDTLIGLLKNDGVRFQGNGIASFSRIEALADGNLLHAEGEWENEALHDPHLVAVSFGPQYGAVTAKQVEDAVRTAYRRGYDALLFAGFSFDGAAQAAIQTDANPDLRVHMVHVAPDVNMEGLLKETNNSHLFTVSGLPRTKLTKRDNGEYVVAMEGVDIYDPLDNTIVSENADGVAAWFLDTDYDGRTFCISQAFFPDASAWNKLARAMKNIVDPEIFASLCGTQSLPFRRGEHSQLAVKVIDPRGNEVMRVHQME